MTWLSSVSIFLVKFRIKVDTYSGNHEKSVHFGAESLSTLLRNMLSHPFPIFYPEVPQALFGALFPITFLAVGMAHFEPGFSGLFHAIADIFGNNNRLKRVFWGSKQCE